MSLAPENYRNALLNVLFNAMLEARCLAREAGQDRIADLMTAVHNIPNFIKEWERCDPKVVRDYLANYDEVWSGGMRLANLYDKNMQKP